MVREKGRSPWALAAHLGVVLAVHVACVLPVFRHPVGLVFVGSITLAHGAIDFLKARWRPRWHLLAFLVDQGLHLAVAWGAFRLWILRFHGAPPAALDGEQLALLWRCTVFVGLAAFNVNGASALVTSVLASIGADVSQPAGERPAQAGRVIGVLERLLVLLLVTQDQWGAVGLVVAAKSIARFRQLEERDFAEKYLVGTLTSVLIAVGSGWLVRAVLG